MYSYELVLLVGFACIVLGFVIFKACQRLAETDDPPREPGTIALVSKIILFLGIALVPVAITLFVWQKNANPQ